MIILLEFAFTGSAHITLDRVEVTKSIVIEDVNTDASVVYFVPKCQFEKPKYGKM